MNTDVNGLEVLSRAEAVALLETQEVGRLVYTRRALPAVIPVNYAVRDGAILIWTGSGSSMAQAVRAAHTHALAA
jgi:nitroimidazol reductase NimA-like FMN-containing flavoprotein (pyridoxamine 5'-phosphate oxidase superfamily)